MLSRYTWPLVATVVSMLLLVGVELLRRRGSSGRWSALVTAQCRGRGDAPVSDALASGAWVSMSRGVLRFVRSYMAHVAGWDVVADTRRHIYQHLQRLSLRFYEDKQTGQLMSRMVNDSDYLSA